MLKQWQIVGEDLALLALKLNQGFVDAGTHENHNDNRSEQIDAIEREWGLVGEPYCAMGECHVYAKAMAFLTGRPTDFATLMQIIHHELSVFFVPSPLCQDMVDAAKRRNIYKTDLRQARPGDLCFFNWKGGSRAQHIEMIVRVVKDVNSNRITALETIGWNTMSGDDGDQSDGGGVYNRTRSSRQCLGFIPINLSNRAALTVHSS